jgi:hypothetical protein
MLLMALFALCTPSTAHASWPGDVVLSDMGSYRGQVVATETVQSGFSQVVSELGVAIANRPVHAVRTLGSAGSEFFVDVNATLIDLAPNDDGAPTGWDLATRARNQVLPVPRVGVRKGLPGSVEVGAAASWVAVSQQGVLSGYARVAPLEGYEPWPDISLQVGYASLVGNPQMYLGALDVTATVGGTLPVGKEPRKVTFSPFGGGGLILVHAHVRVDDPSRDLLFDPDPSRPERAPTHTLGQIFAGFAVGTDKANFRFAASYAPGVAPSAVMGVGFPY